jgi:hypothetical protein
MPPILLALTLAARDEPVAAVHDRQDCRPKSQECDLHRQSW